jgi:hypothetical protein
MCNICNKILLALALFSNSKFIDSLPVFYTETPRHMQNGYTLWPVKQIKAGSIACPAAPIAVLLQKIGEALYVVYKQG